MSKPIPGKQMGISYTVHQKLKVESPIDVRMKFVKRVEVAETDGIKLVVMRGIMLSSQG
jgi:hypothetical protein